MRVLLSKRSVRQRVTSPYDLNFSIIFAFLERFPFNIFLNLTFNLLDPFLASAWWWFAWVFRG
ncbi:hypothetical protein CHAB381_A0003 (plasmid) [Campylobacter hominis ATCC BAA-381]|uniref:Uncharacterized protein n=1 Tax=Campylobacter hominis (strain ATCC BAA-381 / DSM 21671 / CCUG 45161 / LMG 19568 / NCTC 13146 / CH001A) TaxID=360107 RepID=A7HZC9_CAMHC|nr:hypothetical protein CHAB381_A0003 [Campylobacter hominis ATCC BAA-381]